MKQIFFASEFHPEYQLFGTLNIAIPFGELTYPTHGKGKSSSQESLEGIYTWSPNDPCFDWSLGLVLGGLTLKNRNHLGSRYTCVYIYISVFVSSLEGNQGVSHVFRWVKVVWILLGSFELKTGGNFHVRCKSIFSSNKFLGFL